jgi:hypothetical protein
MTERPNHATVIEHKNRSLCDIRHCDGDLQSRQFAEAFTRDGVQDTEANDACVVDEVGRWLPSKPLRRSELRVRKLRDATPTVHDVKRVLVTVRDNDEQPIPDERCRFDVSSWRPRSPHGARSAVDPEQRTLASYDHSSARDQRRPDARAIDSRSPLDRTGIRSHGNGFGAVRAEEQQSAVVGRGCVDLRPQSYVSEPDTLPIACVKRMRKSGPISNDDGAAVDDRARVDRLALAIRTK